MEHNDQQRKMTFSKKGVWLGLVAYLVLIAVVSIVFIVG